MHCTRNYLHDPLQPLQIVRLRYDEVFSGSQHERCAICLKKPHHIITLQFSEVVKDHANHIVHKNQSTYFDLISMDILKCKIQTGQILMLKIHQLYSSILTLAEKEFLHFLDYSLFLLLQEYLLTC